MSTESSKTIYRQWRIMQFLLDGHYASTTSIREHLLSLGIEVEARTVQRDLNLLEAVFPLEHRRDSMPHNWRLKPTEASRVGGLNKSQASILCLVEEQLKDVIPQKLMMELHPLFVRSRFVLGIASEMEQLESLNSTTRSKPSRGGGDYGVIGNPSPIHLILHGVRSVVESAVASATAMLEKKPNDFQALDKALNQLTKIMREQGLEEMVADLN